MSALIDEPIIATCPSLVRAIGLRNAVVLQQVHYREQHEETSGIAGTRQQISDETGLTMKQVRSACDDLVELGLVVVYELQSGDPGSPPKVFGVDREAVETITAPHRKIVGNPRVPKRAACDEIVGNPRVPKRAACPSKSLQIGGCPNGQLDQAAQTGSLSLLTQINKNTLVTEGGPIVDASVDRIITAESQEARRRGLPALREARRRSVAESADDAGE